MKTSFLDSALPLTSALSKLCQVENSPVRVGPSRPLRPLREASPAPVLKFKYVIIRAQDVETAIIVPPFAQHNWAINPDARRPISAGFAWRDADGTVHVEGGSTSLSLDSRPQDAAIIRETLFMNGL